MKKCEKKGPNFLGSKGPIFKLAYSNPYIKSDNLVKTKFLVNLGQEKLASDPMCQQ